MNKLIGLFTLLLIANNCYSQVNQPQYALASKYYSSNSSLGVVVLFKQGIDSINFPIDTSILKVSIKKLDINSKEIQPLKIYYEYRFTPKKDTIYKLPIAQIWLNGKSFPMHFDDSIHLKKSIEKIILSETDSLHLKKEKDGLKRFKLAKSQKLESQINSRIPKNRKSKTTCLWTDKNNYKVNSKFRIVIESNFEFEEINIAPNFTKSTTKKVQLIKTISSIYYENNYKKQYKIFIYKALRSGTITLQPTELYSDNKKIKTNQWTFKIID